MKNFAGPTFGFMLLLLLASCDSSPSVFAYAKRLGAELSELQTDKSAAISSYTDANEARRTAMQEPTITYANPKTKAFIEKWRLAEQRVSTLHTSCDDVIKASDFFFTNLEQKTATISNATLRTTVAGKVSARKQSFSTAAKRAIHAVNSLEAAIRKGNDIVTSLEILGALQEIGDKTSELDRLFAEANAAIPELDQLVSEGNLALQIELGTAN